MARLGVVTIGQAPRMDMVPEMTRHWAGVEIVERGALDNLTSREVEAAGIRNGDEVLTSRMQDGSSVVFGRDLVLPGLQRAITELEGGGADALLLVCTGEFPPFEHDGPLFTASPLLVAGVTGLAAAISGPVGVISPLAEQQVDSVRKFAPLDVITAVANPYGGSPADFEKAAADLLSRRAGLIVLDCMGYTEEHRGWVRAAAPAIPVLVARSVVARLVAEAVAS